MRAGVARADYYQPIVYATVGGTRRETRLHRQTLTIEQNRHLQELLTRMGYDVGRIDGVLGLKSRTAIREVQVKFGLPADSWRRA